MNRQGDAAKKVGFWLSYAKEALETCDNIRFELAKLEQFRMERES